MTARARTLPAMLVAAALTLGAAPASAAEGAIYVPEPVASIATTATTLTSATFTWPESPLATGYGWSLYAADPVAAGTPATATGPATTPSLTLSSLTPCTAYTLSVTATTYNGTIASVPTTSVFSTLCPAPKEVVATAHATSVDLRWDAVERANVYRLGITDATRGSYGEIADLIAGTPSATFEGLVPGTPYDVTVRTNNRSGTWSPTAAAVRIWTLPAAVTTSSVRSSVTPTTAGLTWAAVPSAISYVVQAQGKPASKVAAASASLAGLAPGTTYTVTIRSVGPDGSLSADAAAVRLTTPAAPAPAKLKPVVKITANALSGKKLRTTTRVTVRTTRTTATRNVTLVLAPKKAKTQRRTLSLRWDGHAYTGTATWTSRRPGTIVVTGAGLVTTRRPTPSVASTVSTSTVVGTVHGSSLTFTAKAKPAYGRTVWLQRYTGGKWRTVKVLRTKDRTISRLRITISAPGGARGTTRWRLRAPATPALRAATSRTVTLRTR